MTTDLTHARTAAPPDGAVRAGVAHHAAGVTYRQFDHWCGKGYVTVTGGQGSGNYRYVDNAEVDVVRVAGVLVRDGVTVATAFRLARALAADGTASLGGYTVVTP